MGGNVNNREATATVRGYIYQFDATIISILELNNRGEITVEGVEDFDIENDSFHEYFQCKYYAATKLTPSTIRDAILPMLKVFLDLDESSRNTRCYHLYGYFKESSPDNKTLTVSELKKVLVRHERQQLQSGKYKMREVDMLTEIGATNKDLEVFSQKLMIHICEEYEQHKNKVIEALKSAFQVTKLEAEMHLYPSALTLVSRLATMSSLSSRKIRRKDFINQLRPSRALFNTWFLREKGQEEFCRMIRRNHFSMQNIDAEHRFFIIETREETTNAELLGLISTLRHKWSSHSVQRKPPKERYAPYIYFRLLPNDHLVMLKQTLQDEGVIFVDGYPFNGARFSPIYLSRPQSYENQISLRFINSDSELTETLQNIQGSKSVYEFFLDSPMTTEIRYQHITIPVRSIDMISRII